MVAAPRKRQTQKPSSATWTGEPRSLSQEEKENTVFTWEEETVLGRAVRSWCAFQARVL